MLKKLPFFLIIISSINFIYSQEIKDTLLYKQDTILKEKSWKISGENSLSLNQNSFSNWVAGGNNSFGATAKVSYKFNYKKNKNIWDNKISIGYGQISSEGEKPKKTEDIVGIESTYGYKVYKAWYASIATTFQTQIANGYNYKEYPDYTSTNRKSSFMAPGYLILGIGLEYKPDDDFQLSILPLTTKTTFVLDKKLQKKDNYGLEHDGDWKYVEPGALATLKLKREIMKNIMWENYLTLFSNYIDHAERIDIAYGSVFNMKINDYISSKLTIDIIYDHDLIKKTQVKQTFGVGFSYNFKPKP